MPKKRIKKEKDIGVTSFKDMNKEMREKEKHLYYRVYLFFYRNFWRLVRLPRNTRRAIVRFVQRGIRGWANEDTWGLNYYLADVISKSVYHLKKHNYGYPNELTEGKWIDILNEIRDTFDTAKRIADGTLYLIEDSKKRKEWQIVLDKINIKYKNNDRCMTDNQIKEYKNGWKLFKKYFFNLWD